MESAGINSMSTSVSDVTDSISQVGAGAFGVVWCVSGGASDTGRRYAVKKLCNCLDTLHSAERTYSELKALTSLKHDNILSANTFVLWPNAGNFTDVFVISDLMETDLHRIIASGQTLNKAHIQLFIYQILRGLKYLHSTKIVHSDIKPGNILVNSDCRLKIGDFGLACSETSCLPLQVCSPMTNSSREVRGTLSYVAPELLLGIPAVTTAADLWSTGCLLVEMLTRRVLFPAASTTQQLDMTMEIVGCPRGIEDFRDAAQPAVIYLRQKMTASYKSASKPLLEQLLPTADHTVKHLLTRLLVFTPRQRLSASQALSHVYVNPGQRLYHSTLCSCCKPHSSKDGSSRMNGSDELAFSQHSTTNQVESVCDRLEPVCNDPFCIDDQLGMEAVEDLKGKVQELHTKIRKQRASSDSEYQLTIRSILTQTVPQQ